MSMFVSCRRGAANTRFLRPAVRAAGCYHPRRTYAEAASTTTRTTTDVASHGKQGAETLDAFFTSLSTDAAGAPLPQRFAELKKALFTARLVQSWREVLEELAVETEAVARKGGDCVPQVDYADVKRGLSAEQADAIKAAGVVVVKGGVPQEEAFAWKQSLRDYIEANRSLVKGVPPGNIVFYEIYNSRAQLAARTHPALRTTQRALCALWHVSSSSSAAEDDSAPAISLGTPLAYFDRLRMRPPGPSAFTLGCHIDGGSLERWEDPAFRACFARILEGRWREHDPYDAAPRVGAVQDLYNAANQCTVFRPWQGWTALSSTGPCEGTLRVLPLLRLATAYLILRPFFRPTARAERRGGAAPPLACEDWEPDEGGAGFPGSEPGKVQFLHAHTHPHLRLAETMVRVPRVEPGDQVYWHCDLPHAVESEHEGPGDSSVFYIPAVPLTIRNATYLRAQLDNFKKGLPAPDFFFRGETGEAHFRGRASLADAALAGPEARRMLGAAPFVVPEGADPGAMRAVRAANAILGWEDEERV